jgi:hypothetical protein
MISDVLYDAAYHIRRVLNSHPLSYPPHDPLTKRIEALVTEMEEIQAELDKPPF